MLQRRGFGKIQKSCQTKKLAIFSNEAGQNLVESVQNLKEKMYHIVESVLSRDSL